MFAQEKVNLWREKRPYAIERKQAERQVGFGAAYDKSEFDGWSERIRINDQFEVNTELLGRLIVKVEGNPYPGEQRRVLKLAIDLIPEGGKVGWRSIFQDKEFGFPPNFENERITFPAEVAVDVKEIERRLYEFVREDNTIVAAVVPVVLNLKAHSNAYRAVKSKLEERGWCWVQRREQGKKVKVVVAPPEPC